MKKVVLLGANGLTAREIIPRLLEQKDVELTLFARNASRLARFAQAGINVLEGDAANLADLEQAIKGQDIVISAIGGMATGDLTENIALVMQKHGVRRVIVISAGGIYDELPEPFNTWDKEMVGYTRPVTLKTAQAVEKPYLDYTVLRPVWLTNKAIEEVELTQKGEMFKGTETSRASLGRFIADLVKYPDCHLNENLGIAQPNTDGDRPAAYR